MMTKQATTTALISAALVAALVGCTPTPPAETPTTPVATPVVSATATTEPAPLPAGLTIPDCETLIPIAVARSTYDANIDFQGELPATEYDPWFELPAVTSAISALTLARSCWWSIPNSDGGFRLLVAEIDPATRAAIEAALDGEGFASTASGTIVVREAPDADVTYLAQSHIFTGDLWILVDNGSQEVTGIVADAALAAVRTANPTLGL